MNISRQFFGLQVLLLVVVLQMSVCHAQNGGTIEIHMPKAKPDQPETYLCTSVKLDANRTIYITGFEPAADKKTAHHMLIVGCKTPGKYERIYNCGAMAAKQKGLSSAINPCGLSQSIIFAWAQNAPIFNLPKDVAFQAGGKSEIDYLVLQVHYASIDFIPEAGDTSGVVIHYTNVPKPKSAGVYMTVTQGRFPPRKTTKAEAACRLHTNLTLHPFAFRVHTHALGQVVTGWKVSPEMEWTVLGKDDPQLPQMFNPVDDRSVTLTGGDIIASRCTLYNYHQHEVRVGATTQDEMCNFYLMYWVDGSRLPSESLCHTMGPPVYYWDGWRYGGRLENVPDKEASTYDD